MFRILELHIDMDRQLCRRLCRWLLAEGRLAAPHCLDGSTDSLLNAALDPGGELPAIARLRTALDLGRSVSASPQLPAPGESSPALTAMPMSMMLMTAAAVAAAVAYCCAHALGRRYTCGGVAARGCGL